MFDLARLRFEIELLDNLAPTGFWGTRLRGGYGNSLKNHLCVFPEQKRCLNCELFKDRSCLFPYLFKPHSYLFPELPDGKPIGNSKNLPVPFVIDSPSEIDSTLKKGSRLNFDFTAFGTTLENSLHVMEAFGKLGQVGLDVRNEQGELMKARYQLLEVSDLLAAGRSLHVLGNIASPLVCNVANIIENIRPRQMPDEIVIEFVTPVRILRPEYLPLETPTSKNQTEIARGFRDFYEFVQVLANRIGVIRQTYGSDWTGQGEFFRWRNLLLKASKTIKILEMELRPKSYFRYAKDQHQSIRMDGFVGAVRAAGDFTDLIDFLLIGEILHIGESTAYGFGKYKMIY